MKTCGVLLILLYSLAYAADSGTVRKEITAVYDRLDKALAAKDLNRYFSFMAPDYVEKRHDRIMKLRYVKEDLTGFFGSLQKVAVSRRIQNVTTSGNMIIVDTSYLLSGTYLDKRKKSHTTKTWSTTTDKWVRSGASLLRRNLDVVKQKTLIDGHPIGGSGVGGH